MKIALVFGPGEKETARSILKIFQEIDLDASAFQLGNQWESAGKNLVVQLDAVTHSIFLVSEATLQAPWMPFVFGYGSGRNPKSYLFPVGNVILPEPYKSLFAVLPDFSNLKLFFTAEKSDWNKREALTEARNNLIDSGIGLTDENFSLCIVQGNETAVIDFLTLGFSPDTENSKGVPLLVLAVRNHNMGIAKNLIEKGADVNRKSADRGNTALMDVSVAGDLEMVRTLLDAGADINMKSKNGQTALMLAVGEGKAAVVEELVVHGADLSITDSLGMTAKKYADLFKQATIIDFFNKRTS